MRVIFILTAIFFNLTLLNAQTFTNGLVATGYGSSSIFCDSDIGPDGKFYVLWRYGSNINTSNPQNPYFQLRSWDSSTSTWTVLGSFDQTNIPNQFISSLYTMYESSMGLEIDASGTFHVVFYHFTDTDGKGTITYAKSTNGSSWTFTSLENNGFVSGYSLSDPQLALDQNNYPHVTFKIRDVSSSTIANRRNHLIHFSYNGSSWDRETVLTTYGAVTSTNEINSYAYYIDINGKSHIAASVETNGSGRDGDLLYMNNVSGSWIAPTTILQGATDASASSKVDLVIDANAKAHILSRDYQFAIKYATNKSGSWITSAVATGEINNQSMSINSAGNIFSFYNGTSSSSNSGVVNYAYKEAASSTWNSGNVMTGNSRTGLNPSAELNESNVAMLLFDHYTGTGSPSYGPPNNPRQLQYATASFGSSCTAPSISANPPNRSICINANTTFTITATEATTYQWQVNTGSGFADIANGGIYSNATTNTLNITGATSSMNGYLYRCVAINGTSSCSTNSSSGTLSVSAISLTISSQTNVSCNGASNGAASINTPTGGAGGYTYNWTPGNPTGDGTVSVIGLTAGSWTCTVTDANSCTATQTFTITQPTGMTVTPASQTNVSCNGGSNGAASINTPTGGAGGYTYNWTPGNPTGDGTVSVTGLTAGSWTCTVTDANSCTATQTFTITQPTGMIVTPASQTNVSCNGGSNGAASINTPTGGAGGYIYNWTPGNPTGDGTVSVTDLTAGSWTCTVTDANSCTKTQTFTITQPTAISISPSQTNVSCNGGSNGTATVLASGGTPSYSYSWVPSGGTSATATGLAAGSYTCTVTDANSCTKTQTFTITQPTAISVTPSSQTNVSCNGGSNGAASTNTPTGGAGGYTYNWTPGNPTGDGTLSVTGLTAGSWTCTVTDANSCTATQTFTITQPIGMTVTPASQTNVSCNGGSNGAASINTPTGGAGGYIYNWTPGNPTGDGTVSVTGLTAGSWTCTVTDANSCTATQTFTITQPTAISISPSQTNVSCNGGSNGTATVLASGGTPSYSYSWAPSGGVSATSTGLAAGSYTCTVTDANSCTKTQTFTITQPTGMTVTPASQTNVSCNGGSNGAASINTPTGGAGGYTYNWTPGNPTGDGTVSVTGLTAGSWTCTVTDANSCTATQTFTITQPIGMTVTPASQTNVSCNGGSNGAASINTPTGGAGGYIYNWTPGNPTGDGTLSVTGLTAGSWTCTVTDANSCTKTQTFTITQPTAISISPSQTNVSCNGGSNGTATVLASGGTPSYSYSWAPSGGTSATATGLAAGAYTCTVTDANSCTKTQTFTITQPTAISVTPSSQTNVSCNGGSNGAARINTPTGGAGGYTYTWTQGNPTGDGTVSVTGLTAGSWTCTVTDANSCTATQIFTITQPTAITVTPASQTNVSCNGGSNGAASINTPTGGAGGYTYNWTPGNPTGDGAVSVTGLTAGSWTCTVTDANSCTATQTFTITQPTAISTATAAQTNVSCNGGSNGSASVTPSGGAGGYTYNWAPSGGTAATATGLIAGAYTVTVTDANGCMASRNFTITQPTAISTSTAAQTNVSCNGGSNGSASVTPSGGAGGYTYSWAPSGGTAATATGLSAGAYTVTVTDVNSCTATRTFTITEPAAISTATGSQTNVSCNGGSNGSASVTPSGGAGGYTYNWAPSGGTAATATGLIAGTYTVTVTDANGCTASRTFTITQPTAISTATAAQTNVSCNGGSNGSASVTPSGGAGGYTYSWAPSGGTAATATGLSAGAYTVTVTDANGCMANRSFTITQPTAISTATGSQTNVSCNGGSNGSASVTPSGGAGGYTYSWAPSGGTAATATGLSAGAYIVTITDANGCTDTRTFTITQPTAISISTTAQANVSCFGGSNGTATITASGGIAPYSYSWAPSGGTAATAIGLSAGAYTVTVTDANSCQQTSLVTITQPTALVASISAQTNITCDGPSTGSATVTASGGTVAYAYSWAPSGGTSATATGLAAGTYTITVSDANSCSVTVSTVVTFTNNLQITQHPQNISICQGNNVTFTAQANLPGVAYQWEVNTGAGFTPITASVIYSGQNSSTLSLAFPPLSYNNYKYRCIITLNSCNSTSSEAKLSLAGSAEALNIVNVSPISGVYSQTAVAYTVALNKIQANANVLFNSGNAIELLPGFETKAGVVFATKIESPCGLNTTNNSIFENLPKEIRK